MTPAGHLIPAADASGVVQAPQIGILFPASGGLPQLGQRVHRVKHWRGWRRSLTLPTARPSKPGWPKPVAGSVRPKDLARQRVAAACGNSNSMHWR